MRAALLLATLLGAAILAGCSFTSMMGGGADTSTTASLGGANCAAGQFPIAGRVPPTGDSGPPGEITGGSWAITDNSVDCGCTITLMGGGRADTRGCRHIGLQAVTRFGFATDSGGRELILMGAESDAVLYRLRPDGPNRFSGLMNGLPVIMWLPTS